MISPCHQRYLRKILLAVVLSTLLCSTLLRASEAYAQSETQLTLTARLGFDGHCKENTWVPVHVDVQNTGPDLDTTIQVAYQNNGDGNTTTGLNVLLPANSHKEFFLYIYPRGFIRNMHVSLVSESRILKKVNLAISCLPQENMLFGVLADNPSTYDLLNEVRPLSGFVRVAQLTISDLPASPQAWGSLDALIISNIDTGRLSPEQKQALELWLGAGGKLLVFGGLKWQGTAAGLKDFLPVDINTTVTVSGLPELQAYIRGSDPLRARTVLATGQLHDGGNVIVEQDGIPVIVQKQMGAGEVYYFAADPALQPLSEWSGMKDLYDHLIGFKALSPMWVNRQSSNYYSASQALATIPELGLPSMFYICGLLAFYIVIVGPLNYFVLRRMKRRELAWITIPGLVIIFTGLAYGTGSAYRGRTPILNRLAVMQAWDGIDEARVNALVGIYSPVRAKYDLEATDHFMIQPSTDIGTNLQANNDWTALLQGSKMVMPDVSVEIGGMKTVAFEGSLPALDISHDLVITMDKTKPVLEGNISNKSAYTLRDAFLVTPGQWKRLGNIPPGETIPITISLLNGSTGPVFYSLDAMTILKTDYIAIKTDEDMARRSAFLQSILSSEYGLNRGNWGVYLMGWVDEAMLPVGLQNQGFKTIDTTLYIDTLSPTMKIEPGELTLPASLFAWEASEPNASPYYFSGVPSGGYTLRFRPALPIRFREVSSLQLFLASNALPGELIASAWNYEEKAWSQLRLTGGKTNIPEASRYVGPDGEVTIKVISNRSDWTEITGSYITLVVQP